MEFADAVLNAGKSGTGKSYVLGADIEDKFENGFFPVILDKKDDHKALAKSLGFHRIHLDGKQMRGLKTEVLTDLITNMAAGEAHGLRFTFERRDPEVDQDAFVAFGNKVSQAILSNNEPIALFIEELRNYTPSRRSQSDFNAVETILAEGRSLDKPFGATTQFPQQVHYMIYRNMPIYRVFNLGQNPDDWKKFNLSPEQWNNEERKYWYINENTGERKVQSSKGLKRRTPHSG